MSDTKPLRPLVLVADDDPDLRRMLSAVLRAAGFRTETFANGQSLEQRVLGNGEPPDIILSDIDMPGMDGLTAISEIRKAHPTLPIVMLSAIAEAPRMIPTATACGATLVLSKPIGLVELRRSIEALLTRPDCVPPGETSVSGEAAG